MAADHMGQPFDHPARAFGEFDFEALRRRPTARDARQASSDHVERPSEGLWVGAIWVDGTREIMPLIRQNGDATFDLLDNARYSVAVRAALRAIVDEHAVSLTPRMYRITPAHLERHPVLIGAVLGGRWQRHARDGTSQ